MSIGINRGLTLQVAGLCLPCCGYTCKITRHLRRSLKTKISFALCAATRAATCKSAAPTWDARHSTTVTRWAPQPCPWASLGAAPGGWHPSGLHAPGRPRLCNWRQCGQLTPSLWRRASRKTAFSGVAAAALRLGTTRHLSPLVEPPVEDVLVAGAGLQLLYPLVHAIEITARRSRCRSSDD